MINSKQTVTKKVAAVQKDLELQANYKLTPEQVDELRLTGRTGIEITKFAPYLNQTVTYLSQSRNEDVVWELALNTISGDFEIELKGYHLLF